METFYQALQQKAMKRAMKHLNRFNGVSFFIIHI